MHNKELNIIISGGGTGGHVFPAIAIADALTKRLEKANILFVGASGKMEMEKVPAAGYKIIGIPVRGFQRKLSFSNLMFPFRLLYSLFRSRRIIRQFKPDVVVGVGGYASGPLLRMAAMAGIPTLIQEQNSYPGITNKLLARKVDKICVAYEGMEKFFPARKIILCGNPVRKDFLDLKGKKNTAADFFNLDPNKKTVLITGGSLGARTINESIHKRLNLLIEQGLQVIWQCGRIYYPQVDDLIPQVQEKGIRIFKFISKMDLAYAMADVVVSRAGAIAISELSVTGKPAILVPSPNVAEDHQTHNALALVRKNAAIMIKDSEAQEKLVSEIIALLNDEDRQNELATNIAKNAFNEAADTIASEVIELAVSKMN